MSRAGSHRNRWSRAAIVGGALVVLLGMMVQFSLWPVHVLQRFHARERMELQLLAGLPESRKSVLSFTPAAYAQLEFEEEGRELWFDGALYDVLSVHQLADGAVSVCAVKDVEESALLDDLESLLHDLEENEEGGQGQRMEVSEVWEPYCEQFSTACMHVSSVGRHFGPVGSVRGIGAVAVDPDPPRRV